MELKQIKQIGVDAKTELQTNGVTTHYLMLMIEYHQEYSMHYDNMVGSSLTMDDETCTRKWQWHADKMDSFYNRFIRMNNKRSEIVEKNHQTIVENGLQSNDVECMCCDTDCDNFNYGTCNCTNDKNVDCFKKCEFACTHNCECYMYTDIENDKPIKCKTCENKILAYDGHCPIDNGTCDAICKMDCGKCDKMECYESNENKLK